MKTIDPSRYVVVRDPIFDKFQFELKTDDRIKHLDGVEWWNAKLPRSWHKCWPQTIGNIRDDETIWRCACGALAFADMPPIIWLDRNSSRKSRKKHKSKN